MAPSLSANSKGAVQHHFEHIRMLRFKLISRAGTIVRLHGRVTLDVGPTPKIAELFRKVTSKLEIAA